MRAQLHELVSTLSAGINHAGIYGTEHTRVRESAAEFVRVLRSAIEEDGVDGFFLGVVGGRLVAEGRPLLGPTVIAKRLIDAATRLCTGGFLFHRDLVEDEAVRFLRLCTDRTACAQHLAECRGLMTLRGLVHVAPSPLYGEPGWLGDHWEGPQGGRVKEEVPPAGVVAAVAILQSLLGVVQDVFAAAHAEREVDVASSLSAAAGMVDALAQGPADLLSLAVYPDFESYTIGHSVRTALLTVLVAQEAGLPRDFRVEVGSAALLHDVGKVRIPHEILFKRGRLDEEEARVMSTHSVLGAEALLQSRGASGLSVAAAFGHHVRRDRRGYPQVEPWVSTSRITGWIQACDIFEALTSVRPYKPCLTARRAFEIMLQDPGAYTPDALAALFRAVGLYPPGSRVRLSTREQATVVRAGADPMRPRVRVSHDAEGRPLVEEERFVVDLGADPVPEGRYVTEPILDEHRDVPADPGAYAKRPLTVWTDGRSAPPVDAA